ncbi:MAG: DoxX family protein [Balneolaceae bacterium]|nr:DoxX family protein [Balneolaceae bacterium]
MYQKSLQFLLQTSQDSIQSVAIFLLRVGVSISMLFLHGWPKLSNYIDGNVNLFDPLGIGYELSLLLAIFAEIICSVLLILGLFSRVSAIPLIITMLVAIFIVNAGQPLIVKERAFLFLMTYAFILLAGPGKYSIDAKLNKAFRSSHNQ